MVQLHEKAGILHRDISYTNLMAEEIDGSFRGILNDFDLAVMNNNLAKSSLERTGTLPFMALALLKNPTNLPHLFRHDVESLFYVLVWIAVQYDERGNRIKTKQIEDWRAAETIEAMRKAKNDFLIDPMKNLVLTGFYQDLERWITKFSLMVKKLQVEPLYTADRHRAYLKELEEDWEEVSMLVDDEPSSWMNQMVEGGSISDERLIITLQKMFADTN